MSKKKKTLTERTRWRAENSKSASDLNNSVPFNTTLVFAKNSALHDTYRQLQDAFIEIISNAPIPDGLCTPIATGAKREAISKRNAETLLANLFNMKNHKTLSVSLDHTKYSPTKLSGTGFVNLVKLASHDSRMLMCLRKGFQDLSNPKNSRNARIWPTKKFWSLMEANVVCDDDIVSIPHDLINLRQTIGKGKGKQKIAIPRKVWIKELKPKQLDWLHIIEGTLGWFNLVYGEYEMKYTSEESGCHFLHPSLYTVYTNDFTQGGRFYTGKGGHQSLPKQERSTITFNGHKTVELDYGGMHIRMLYHMGGLAFPVKKCPYEAVLQAMNKDPKRLFKKYPKLKGELKKIVFGMVNGTVAKRNNLFAKAVNRSNYTLFNNFDEDSKIRNERQKRWKRLGLLDSNDKPTPVIRAFGKAHKPIRNKFYSGTGLSLQNIDAQIAYWIMAEMMFSDSDCCIPCLPVHDSFITFSEYKNTLKKAMKMVYAEVMKQHTNTKKIPEIPIKTPSS